MAATATAQRPPSTTNAAYTAASALYQAGFRGPALVVMTAIAGRETGWNPSETDPGDPAGGSYGLLQINGSHAGVAGGTQAFQTWAQSMLDPITNAKEAYSLSNGGKNLQPWALTWNGTDPATAVPTANQGLVNGVETPVNYSITPYLATATAAAAKATAKPLTPAQIGSSAEAASTGPMGPIGSSAATASTSSSTSGSDCLLTLPVIGCVLHRSQAKALLGAASMAGGALLGVGTIALIVALSKGSAIKSVGQAAQIATSAPQRSRERTAKRESTRAATASSRSKAASATAEAAEAPARAKHATATQKSRADVGRARARQERSRARQEEDAEGSLRASGTAAGGTSRAAGSAERSRRAAAQTRYKATSRSTPSGANHRGGRVRAGGAGGAQPSDTPF